MSKVTTRDAGAAIEARQEFTTSGALRGTRIPSTVGYLPAPWREQYFGDRNRIDYAVMSYDTPIAWHLTSGEWIIPGVRYSPTTTKHQGNLSRVMAPGTHRGMMGQDRGRKA